MAEPARTEQMIVRRTSGESRMLAESLPRLVLDARRIAAGMIHGLHGRRRAGPGESFWQYRRFASGEPAQNVDWRRSGRDEHLYVREREWEAAHTVWLWPDRSLSMAFASPRAVHSKLERTLIVTFALAQLLVDAGERVGIPGLMPPSANRNIIDKIAQALLHDNQARASLPAAFSPSPLAEIIVLSDLWSPIADVRAMIAALSASGAQGTLVQVVDEAEETFPYAGRVEFVEPESGELIVAGRAEHWARDYQNRIALHRDSIRDETLRRNWQFFIHRTDRPASELMLLLHGALGNGALGNGALGSHAGALHMRPAAAPLTARPGA